MLSCNTARELHFRQRHEWYVSLLPGQLTIQQDGAGLWMMMVVTLHNGPQFLTYHSIVLSCCDVHVKKLVRTVNASEMVCDAQSCVHVMDYVTNTRLKLFLQINNRLCLTTKNDHQCLRTNDKMLKRTSILTMNWKLYWWYWCVTNSLGVYNACFSFLL